MITGRVIGDLAVKLVFVMLLVCFAGKCVKFGLLACGFVLKCQARGGRQCPNRSVYELKFLGRFCGIVLMSHFFWGLAW